MRAPPETLSHRDLEEAGVIGTLPSHFVQSVLRASVFSQGSWVVGSKRWTQNPRQAQLHFVLCTTYDLAIFSLEAK